MFVTSFVSINSVKYLPTSCMSIANIVQMVKCIIEKFQLTALLAGVETKPFS